MHSEGSLDHAAAPNTLYLNILARCNQEQIRLLELLSNGLTDEQVAHELEIKKRTLNNRKQALFQALGVRNRTGAVSLWSRAKTASSVLNPEAPTLDTTEFAKKMVADVYAATMALTIVQQEAPTNPLSTLALSHLADACKRLEADLDQLRSSLRAYYSRDSGEGNK